MAAHPLSHTQDKGRAFRESFLSKLALLLRGTVAAPADRFGETLGDEHLRGGEYGMGQYARHTLPSESSARDRRAALLMLAAFIISLTHQPPVPFPLPLRPAGAFVGSSGEPLALPGALPNANMRLYGGAQFHRAMAEFRMAVGQLTCPDIRCGVEAAAAG